MSAVLSEPTPHLRKMTPEDLPAVLLVENGSYTHPWSEGILRDCLRVTVGTAEENAAFLQALDQALSA